jgi:phospholipase/lecithinase/hemolysin
MRQYYLAAAILASTMLAGCGGGSSGVSQSPKVQFTSMVTFGDSLSDVGSYKVGQVAAVGGGQFTINGTGKNWTELMAAQLGLSAPCAYETGLDGSVFGVGVTISTHPGCTGYAQGGARVTNPYGPGNKALAAINPGYGQLGQLTRPITTQIDNHLATLTGGKFTGSEVVFVLAGANDVLIQFATYGAAVKANPASASAAGAAAVTAVATAATELSGYINNKLIANGAKYVVVVNMPDVSSTPFAAGYEAAAPGSKAFINTMVTTFNNTLQTGLASNGANVLFVDAYTIHRDEVSNPAAYSLTNVTTPACDLSGVATNPLKSALMCNAANLAAGVTADNHYLFADDVHPTPYGYLLLARLVSKDMLIKGWM